MRFRVLIELNLTTLLFEKFHISVSKLELLYKKKKITIPVRSEMHKYKYLIKVHVAA